jgi:hypothetical protein
VSLFQDYSQRRMPSAERLSSSLGARSCQLRESGEPPASAALGAERGRLSSGYMFRRIRDRETAPDAVPRCHGSASTFINSLSVDVGASIEHHAKTQGELVRQARFGEERREAVAHDTFLQ